jgi:hypothetical protein
MACLGYNPVMHIAHVIKEYFHLILPLEYAAESYTTIQALPNGKPKV